MRTTAGLVLCFALGMAGAPSWAAPPPPELSLQQLTEQGIHYYKRRMYGPAMANLEQARALPGGDQDYRILSVLSRIYLEQQLLEKAFPAAQEALALAKPEQRDEAEAFLAGMQERFGGVTFRKAREQMGTITRGIIHLEDRGGLIEPQKKRVFESIAARFKKTEVELPITLYLPFGSYAANRAPFTVARDQVAEVELILYSTKEAEGISPWWYVGGAAVVVAATATVVALLLSGEEPEDVQLLEIGDVRLRSAPAAAAGSGD